MGSVGVGEAKMEERSKEEKEVRWPTWAWGCRQGPRPPRRRSASQKQGRSEQGREKRVIDPVSVGCSRCRWVGQGFKVVLRSRSPWRIRMQQCAQSECANKVIGRGGLSAEKECGEEEKAAQFFRDGRVMGWMKARRTAFVPFSVLQGSARTSHPKPMAMPRLDRLLFPTRARKAGGPGGGRGVSVHCL